MLGARLGQELDLTVGGAGASQEGRSPPEGQSQSFPWALPHPGSPGCLSCQHILVAQRQVHVAEEALQDFHRALCCYVDFTGAQSRCLQ